MDCVHLIFILLWICAYFAYRKHRKNRILKPADLAKVFTPKKIPRGVTCDGKYCFYFEDLAEGSKEREVGDCFGTVQDSALKKWLVEFHDGVHEHMGPKQMAMSLQVCALALNLRLLTFVCLFKLQAHSRNHY